MKILLPGHSSKEFLDKIDEVCPGTTVERLTIHRQRSLIVRSLRFLSKRMFPYSFYKAIKPLLSKENILFSVNGKLVNGEISDAEVLLVSWVLNRDILTQLLPRLPNLKWIHSEMTGVDHIVSALQGRNSVILTNVGNVHSKRIAEFILGLIFSVSKRIPDHLILQQQRKWHSLASTELYKSTIGIIGLGNIGSELATRSKALGMKVIAMDNEPKNNKDVDIFVTPQQINTLLSQADYVVLCCSLNDQTKGIIGKEQLSMMKKEAYLVNVARGALIQEDALFRALKDGWIKGACLDVFEDEPLSLQSQFYTMSNIILTHHSAFYSEEAEFERFDIFLKNLSLFLKNAVLINRISLDLQKAQR